jgi:hypothetical protein
LTSVAGLVETIALLAGSQKKLSCVVSFTVAGSDLAIAILNVLSSVKLLTDSFKVLNSSFLPEAQ